MKDNRDFWRGYNLGRSGGSDGNWRFSDTDGMIIGWICIIVGIALIISVLA